jgi:hypothetical protein
MPEKKVVNSINWPQYVMAKALQSVVVVLVGSPDATRKDVCVEKMD